MILTRKYNKNLILFTSSKQVCKIKNMSKIKKCGEMWSNVGENVYL